jgi:hypothetical protein
MTGLFSTISKIDPNQKSTWFDKVFLTFDLDWAHDDILKDTVALISEARVAATWFVTHATPVLDDIKALPGQELGIHPNFNPLLEGPNTLRSNSKGILKNLLEIVPEAQSIRSHSMTQSSQLLNLFQSGGLTHEVNHFIPHHTGITLKPWILWNHLVKVPYFWEDDVHVLYETIDISQKTPVEIALAGDGLKVFDFHPIHIFLNTESLDRYERTRSMHQNPKELIKHRYKGLGTRTHLIALLKLARSLSAVNLSHDRVNL